MTNERRWNEPVLAETNVRRQHYVPQFYLRAFADNNEQVDVFDLARGVGFRTSITNIAVESGLYDIDLGGGMRVSTETWLMEVETDAAPIVQRLIGDPASLLSLSDTEEMLLARFVAAMLFRGPAFRELSERLEGDIVTNLKESTRSLLFNGKLYKGISTDEATEIWEEWEQQPNAWWLGEEQLLPHAAGVADMFSETQGFANLLRAKPWRIGKIVERSLYTADNPVGAHLTPIRPWWDFGGMMSLDYWFPISPDVLLRLERRVQAEDADAPLRPKGPRRHADFSEWETSVARHVITASASRFLLGTGPHISKSCARGCLTRIDQMVLADAIAYGGFDPRPPRPPLN